MWGPQLTLGAGCASAAQPLVPSRPLPLCPCSVPGASTPKVVAGSAGLTINGLPADLYPTVPGRERTAGLHASGRLPAEAPLAREVQEGASHQLARHVLVAFTIVATFAFALWRVRAMRA